MGELVSSLSLSPISTHLVSSICNNCDTSEAVIDCHECKAILCHTCSKTIHAPKIHLHHQLVVLSAANGSRPSGRCKEHNKLCEYFCVPCKHSVCASCCIVGYI